MRHIYEPPLYIEGAIASSVEDVEGNTFDPALMDTDHFLREGFLDVDHLTHTMGIQEANIGKPVAVWRDKDRLFARFLLKPTEFGKEIYRYVKSHPYILSFSIAGDMEKGWFARDGKWKVQSCALTHVPKQPDAYAVALSGTGMTIRGIMSAFLGDLRHNTVDVASFDKLRDYFYAMSNNPVLSMQLAGWAQRHLMSGSPKVDLVQVLRENLFFPDDQVNGFALDTKAQLAEWKLLHPDDEHLTDDGRFRSEDDAVFHLRYCMRLNPNQVAGIMGRLRGTDVFEHRRGAS